MSSLWSSSFYWGRRFPCCHNKTLAAAKPVRELQGEESCPRLCSWAHLWISVTPPSHPPPPLPSCLPLPSYFWYDLIVSCLAPPTLAHAPASRLHHTPLNLHLPVSSASSPTPLLLLFSHDASYLSFETQLKPEVMLLFATYWMLPEEILSQCSSWNYFVCVTHSVLLCCAALVYWNKNIWAFWKHAVTLFDKTLNEWNNGYKSKSMSSSRFGYNHVCFFVPSIRHYKQSIPIAKWSSCLTGCY